MMQLAFSSSRPPAVAFAADAVFAVTEPAIDVLRTLFDQERTRWQLLDPALGSFVEDLGHFVLNGGKRLRPALVHWGFVAAGGQASDPRPAVVAAAVELVHAFALLHDDVMDGGELRRGNPSYHRVWREQHQRNRWSGESRRFGEGLAILAGDLAFVYADRLLSGVSDEVRDVWDDLRTEVTMGQHLDLLDAACRERGSRRAVAIAEYKTARYSVERPLQLGAVLAGGPPLVVDGLRAFGRRLGAAFQYRDDLLGALGDPRSTGKPVGDDLREGKATYLLALAFERASDAELEVLQRVGRDDLDDADVVRVQQVLRECGAVDALEAEIHRLRGEAVDSLTGVSIPPEAELALITLADLLTNRDR
jgi:geranylgeranyl diphosphate synthase type I